MASLFLFSKQPITVMTKWMAPLLIALTALLLSGCFDLHEEITLNKNGSGTYAMILDLSEIMDMVATFSEEPELAKDSLRLSMDSTLTESKNKIRQVQGISNVSGRMEGGEMHLSYDFADVGALNEANQQLGEEDEGLSPQMFTYRFAKGLFARTQSMKSPEEEEIDEESIQMAKMLFGDSKFTTVYHLPGKVKKVSKENVTLSDRKRTITHEVPLVDVMEKKSDLSLEIRFK